jgi:hypothetical protein
MSGSFGARGSLFSAVQHGNSNLLKTPFYVRYDCSGWCSRNQGNFRIGDQPPRIVNECIVSKPPSS